jgi:hypothetical protein
MTQNLTDLNAEIAHTMHRLNEMVTACDDLKERLARIRDDAAQTGTILAAMVKDREALELADELCDRETETLGTDIPEQPGEPVTLNLGQYKTAGGAAKALHRHLMAYWDNPADLVLLTPERSEELGYGRVWRVMWEGGPYDWGVKMSGDFTYWGVGGYNDRGRAGDWYLEPYYSFDVGFCR